MLTLTLPDGSTLHLSSHPMDARYLAWRDADGRRVSQYSRTVAGAYRRVSYRLR